MSAIMEYEEESGRPKSTEVRQLKNKKGFDVWRRQTISIARSNGYLKYFEEDPVEDDEATGLRLYTRQEVDTARDEYEAEEDRNEKARKKLRYLRVKREFHYAASACNALMLSVNDEGLSLILESLDGEPKKMWEAICNRYERKSSSALGTAIKTLQSFKLHSVKKEPLTEFNKAIKLNRFIGTLKPSCMKDDIGLALLFTEGLGSKYETVKTIMEQDDDYLEDLEGIMDRVQKHWERHYEGNASEDDSGSESSEDEEDEDNEEKGENQQEQESAFLTAMDPKNERKGSNNDSTYVRKCYLCGSPDHIKRNCPRLTNNRADRNKNDMRNWFNDGEPICFICGETGHKSFQCPKKQGGGNNRDSVNNLFVGMIAEAWEGQNTDVHEEDSRSPENLEAPKMFEEEEEEMTLKIDSMTLDDECSDPCNLFVGTHTTIAEMGYNDCECHICVTVRDAKRQGIDKLKRLLSSQLGTLYKFCDGDKAGGKYPMCKCNTCEERRECEEMALHLLEAEFSEERKWGRKYCAEDVDCQDTDYFLKHYEVSHSYDTKEAVPFEKINWRMVRCDCTKCIPTFEGWYGNYEYGPIGIDEFVKKRSGGYLNGPCSERNLAAVGLNSFCMPIQENDPHHDVHMEVIDRERDREEDDIETVMHNNDDEEESDDENTEQDQDTKMPATTSEGKKERLCIKDINPKNISFDIASFPCF